MNNDTRVCPFCGEIIKADALKCRYCREWLNSATAEAGATATAAKEVKPEVRAVPIVMPGALKPLDVPAAAPVAAPVKVAPVATYLPDAAVHCDAGKANSKLKEWYCNCYLPWYKNSYLIFFILTGLLYVIGKKLIDSAVFAYAFRYGSEYGACFSFVSSSLAGISTAISSALLAAGMLLIAARDDEEKFRKTFHTLILPLIAVILLPIAYKCVFPPEPGMWSGMVNNELFRTALWHYTIILILESMAKILLVLLIAQGKFGRLFLCMFLPVIAALLAMLRVEATGLPHPMIFPVAVWGIILISALIFTWKMIFRNIWRGFDWRLPARWCWYGFCIFGAVYFSQKFAIDALFRWAGFLHKIIVTPYIGNGVWFILCMWSSCRAAERNRLAFLLKTIGFALIGCGLMVLMNFVYAGAQPNDTWTSTREFVTCVSVISLLFTIKAISNAYYCNIKWHFMLPLNMFLLLFGCVPILQWILPGDNPRALIWLEKLNIPVEYGAVFLVLSCLVDIFAIIHCLIDRKKPFELSPKVYLACSVAAVLVTLYGMFAVDRARANKAVENVLVLSKDGRTVSGVMSSNITSVTIPEGVTAIGEGAFAHCDNLTEVVISDGVTAIGERAFAYCRNLTAIKIPDSVNWINATAFSFCSKLKTLEIPQNCTYKDEFHFFPGKVIRRQAGTP